MESAKNPNADHVFGYFFDDPCPNAPEPPHGAPLLSDTEHKALNSFFDDMTSDQPAEFIHSESWMDLPPQFMGSASYMGQNVNPLLDPISTHELLRDVFSDLPIPASLAMPPPPPQPAPPSAPATQLTHLQAQPALSLPRATSSVSATSTLSSPALAEQPPSADVLEAASVLQNGSLGSRASSFHFGARPTFTQNELEDHQPHGLSVIDGSASRSMSMSAVPPATLVSPSDLHLQREQLPPMSARVAQFHRLDLRWGSDQSFSGGQFVPSSETEAADGVPRKMAGMLCREEKQSATVTRPLEPGYDVVLNHLGLKAGSLGVASGMSANGTVHDSSVGVVSPPRKRRRHRASIDHDGGEDDEGIGSLRVGVTNEEGGDADQAWGKSRKRKTLSASESGLRSNGAAVVSTHAQSGKGRRSRSVGIANLAGLAGPASGGTAGSKTQRENLSDEQKRENHIKSEQRRRGQIKDGFANLCQAVPGLQGGGFSKSVTLTMACEWIEELNKDTERMVQQLQALGG